MKHKFLLLLILSLLSWSGSVSFQISSLNGFGAGGLFILFIAAWVVFFLIAVFRSLITKNWFFSLCVGSMLVALFSSIPIADSISRRQWSASVRAAQLLINAVDSFHGVNGEYPKSVQDLVPTFLESEPRTRMGFSGAPFKYTRDPNGYRIEFDVPWFKWWTYDSENKNWTMGD